jgi:ribosome modulation factor
VRLLDVEPPVFNMFVEWLYTQQPPQSCHAYDSVAYQKGEVVGDDNDMLKIKLYVLADRLMVLSLRRVLNRTIVNGIESDYPLLWRYQPIIYAYNNLRMTDSLLDLFVDRRYMAWAEECDSYDNWELMDDLPRDFLLRFYKRVGIERNSRRGHAAGIFNTDFCSYHEHDSDADWMLCDRKGKSCPKKALLRRPVDGG